MSDEMSDEEFLGYCSIHCRTERALFSGSQMKRLCLLAGEDAWAKSWEGNEKVWRGFGPGAVDPMVETAYERLRQNEPEKGGRTTLLTEK